jgi:hypothetical protein
MYMREGYVKRAYFMGPVALLRASSPSSPAPIPQLASGEGFIMGWLDSKPDRSVVYISFGSMAHIKDAQLDELAVGIETSGTSFLWVVRGKEESMVEKGPIPGSFGPLVPVAEPGSITRDQYRSRFQHEPESIGLHVDALQRDAPWVNGPGS